MSLDLSPIQLKEMLPKNLLADSLNVVLLQNGLSEKPQQKRISFLPIPTICRRY